MSAQEIRGLLGLAQRAGQLLLGSDRALDHIRRRQSGLLLLDESASANTRKRLTDACKHHEVALRLLPGELLGDALGRPGTMAALMLPGGLTERLQKLPQDEHLPKD